MAKGEVWGEEEISDFLEEAAIIDKWQISVGKMAQEKASNESVKIYGQLLVDEHTKSLNELQRVAQLQNITIPDTMDREHQQKVNELERLEGAAFERRFLQMMVEAHRDDIEKYEDAQENIPDDHEAKEWLDETLASLHRHHQKGQQLQEGESPE